MLKKIENKCNILLLNKMKAILTLISLKTKFKFYFTDFKWTIVNVYINIFLNPSNDFQLELIYVLFLNRFKFWKKITDTHNKLWYSDETIRCFSVFGSLICKNVYVNYIYIYIII